MEKQAMHMVIRIYKNKVIFINSQIGPSTRQGIGLSHNQRLRFQTNVPGFGFGSHICLLYLIPCLITIFDSYI